MGFSSPDRGGHTAALQGLETSPLPVTAVMQHYPAAHVVPKHEHDRGHLLYAAEGVLQVQASSGHWLVPPTAAVWLRPGVAHQLLIPVAARVHGVFIREDVAQQLPSQDGVLQVSPLLRELIISLSQLPESDACGAREVLLGQLLVAELAIQPSLPFYLPWPADKQMRQVCDALLKDPTYRASAEQWANDLALGTKTFHRHFFKSCGLTFGRWRQQLRLMVSISPLLAGAPITQVALNSGYESHSAYAVAFKKHFGLAPSEFYASSLLARGNEAN